MFETLTDVVFQVTCGTVNGTCFLINKNTAITVFHVIKEYESCEITILKNCSKIASAQLHKNIDSNCKSKDFAILTLDRDLTFSKYLEFGLIENIEVGSKWISRGYPLPKSCNGENILPHADNSIGQHFTEITEKKIDIELNHNKKWDSYEGLSGAPLIINNKVVGLINSELTSQQTSRELYALSVKSLKDILISNNIVVDDEDFHREVNIDTSGAEDFQNLTSTDIRNLPIKLKDVCATISDVRVNLYCRELASGKAELLRYRDQDISATKYRIFEVCQKELLLFVEGNVETELEVSDIDKLLELYALKASVVIEERSKDYRYPLKNKDVLRKIVLDLINECFLSFDEKGIL